MEDNPELCTRSRMVQRLETRHYQACFPVLSS